MEESRIVKAKAFGKQPAATFRAADKGLNVVIDHGHYPDVYFILTPIDKAKWEAGITNEPT
jgi:hypothetical protein